MAHYCSVPQQNWPHSHVRHWLNFSDKLIEQSCQPKKDTELFTQNNQGSWRKVLNEKKLVLTPQTSYMQINEENFTIVLLALFVDIWQKTLRRNTVSTYPEQNVESK